MEIPASLFLRFLSDPHGPFCLGSLLELSGGLVMGNGLTDNSPVLRRYNMRFDQEIYALRFFNVSHLS
jgi:hypothetical protein